MNESVLRDFFSGKVDGARLADDLHGSRKQVSPKAFDLEIHDMDEPFEVSRAMLTSLCDAVLAGAIPAEGLEIIGFALLASDHFEWEDDVMADVISDWSCPEVNYPLNLSTVRNFKSWLANEAPYPERPTSIPKDGKAVSVTSKKFV